MAFLASAFYTLDTQAVNPFHSRYQKSGTLAKSEDPDEMQHKAAFHLGLHCVLRYKQSSSPGCVAQSIASLTAYPRSQVRSQPGPILLWRLIMKLFLLSFSSFC